MDNPRPSDFACLAVQDNYAIQGVAGQMMQCIASFGSLPRTLWYLTRVAIEAMRG